MSAESRRDGRGAYGARPAREAHASRVAPRAEAALVFFAKAPVPGEVKTRLCPPLTPDEAASLHGSFVLDALERSAGVASKGGARAGVDRFVACLPSSDHVFFKILGERHGVRLLDQQGPDVGARMDGAFQALFAQGYARVIIVGTDLPTLPASIYPEALNLLATHDVVVGPALDGGYYLIGLTAAQPDLFRDIPWSTDRVLSLTQHRAAAAGLKMGMLSPLRDIDTIDDLRALIQDYGLGARGKRQGAGTSHPGQPMASRPWPVADGLSKRTEGAIRLLAGRYPAYLKG